MVKKVHNQRHLTVPGSGQPAFFGKCHSWVSLRLRGSQSDTAAFMAFFGMSASMCAQH